MDERRGKWDLYNAGNSFMAWFETPEDAMRFMYCSFLYGAMAGKEIDLLDMEWQDDGHGQIRGYVNGKQCYSIQRQQSAGTSCFGMSEWVAEKVEAGEVKSFDDWLNVIEVKQDAL